jgi:hypothetical protein
VDRAPYVVDDLSRRATFCVLSRPESLLNLSHKSIKLIINKQKSMEPIASYLRSHRRKSGFSLDELAQILGSVSAAQISRHERSLSVPGLLVTLGYEAFFEVPISEPFPGLYGTINAGIEERLRE